VYDLIFIRDGQARWLPAYIPTCIAAIAIDHKNTFTALQQQFVLSPCNVALAERILDADPFAECSLWTRPVQRVRYGRVLIPVQNR
jgi:hypothetical protein